MPARMPSSTAVPGVPGDRVAAAGAPQGAPPAGIGHERVDGAGQRGGVRGRHEQPGHPVLDAAGTWPDAGRDDRQRRGGVLVDLQRREVLVRGVLRGG